MARSKVSSVVGKKGDRRAAILSCVGGAAESLGEDIGEGVNDSTEGSEVFSCRRAERRGVEDRESIA